jgi:type IV fimbrial biogenesis protein FimT
MFPLKVKANTRGFTLIELIVTLAVAAILLAFAVPAFNDYFDKARLRGAADDVASFLASARTQSVMRDRDVVVRFVGNGATWCVGANSALDPANPGDPVPAAVACDCTTAGACLIGADVFETNSARFRGVALVGAVADLTYDSNLGTLANLTAASARLNSPSGKFALIVNVSPLGQVNTCIPAGSPLVPGYPSC